MKNIISVLIVCVPLSVFLWQQGESNKIELRLDCENRRGIASEIARKNYDKRVTLEEKICAAKGGGAVKEIECFMGFLR